MAQLGRLHLLTPEEKQHGPWLSEQAKEQAQAFNMHQHLAKHRVAFSREVSKLFEASF